MLKKIWLSFCVAISVFLAGLIIADNGVGVFFNWNDKGIASTIMVCSPLVFYKISMIWIAWLKRPERRKTIFILPDSELAEHSKKILLLIVSVEKFLKTAEWFETDEEFKEFAGSIDIGAELLDRDLIRPFGTPRDINQKLAKILIELIKINQNRLESGPINLGKAHQICNQSFAEISDTKSA